MRARRRAPKTDEPMNTNSPEGIVSKRLGSHYRSSRSRDWLKMKNPAAPAVRREAEKGSELTTILQRRTRPP
jgi:hypothetical protein